jgi:hypothetical protein
MEATVALLQVLPHHLPGGMWKTTRHLSGHCLEILTQNLLNNKHMCYLLTSCTVNVNTVTWPVIATITVILLTIHA